MALSRKVAAEYAWSYVSGELVSGAGGRSAAELSEECLSRGDWVGGEIWAACAAGLSFSEVVERLRERSVSEC